MLPTRMVRFILGLLGACVWLTASIAAATAQQGGCVSASSVDQIARQLAQAQAQMRGAGCTGLFGLFQPRGMCSAMTAQVRALEAQLWQAQRQRQSPQRLSNSVIHLPSQDAAMAPDCGKPAYRSARVVCVRLCDGYYFPVNHSVKQKNLAKDEEKCLSQYPEGQAALYIDRSGGENVASMVSLEGKRKYGDQPFAFNFQRFYNRTCPRPGAHLADAARAAAKAASSPEAISAVHATAHADAFAAATEGVRLVGPPYAYYFPERGNDTTLAADAPKPDAAAAVRAAIGKAQPVSVTESAILQDARVSVAGD